MQQALALIGEDLKNVELQFKKDLRSDVLLIRKVSEYVLGSGGKRFRPALLLLCARLCGYQGERSVPLASVVEFIHTATLLHDDVVDNADIRRGNASANTLWGNETSVLVGDFLFSKSFALMVGDGDLRILKVMSEATTLIAEGEVLQLEFISDLNVTVDQCLTIIRNKTAILIAAACQVGAILGNASPEQEQALNDFGMELGIAFQLKDDTLDYVSSQEQFGKSIGHDLEEGKVTMPLIHTLACCTPAEQEVIAAVLSADTLSRVDFQTVTDLVHRYGGIEATAALAEERIDRAKKLLHMFPPSAAREALCDLADYVGARER